MKFKTTVAIDFDGVLHEYCSPWTNTTEVNDGPTPGALDVVRDYLAAGFQVVIYSARACTRSNGTNGEFEVGGGKEAIQRWLKSYGFPELEISAEKPHAQIYIDDRAYLFDGTNWPTVPYIRNFKPWNRQPPEWQQKKLMVNAAKKLAEVRRIRQNIGEAFEDNELILRDDLDRDLRKLCELLDEVVL